MMRFIACAQSAVLCLLLAGCAELTLPQKAGDQVYLKETSFDQLPGWDADATGEAVIPLQRSCRHIMKKDSDAELGVGSFAGTVSEWQDICRDLSSVVPMTNAEARAFFETHFTPYELSGDNGREGLFTGYYEPLLHGSYRRHKPFLTPIYGRPADLVSADLGDFKPALKGEKIMGRVSGEEFVPYYTRAEIEDGALKKQRKEIVWVDSPVDAFFLHIQGSGQIKMDNGRTLHVGYAAANGQPYVAIGKKLLERGALEEDDVSMQSIRAWLGAHPDEAAEVMNLDTSYIFFRKLTNEDGPIGAEGVPLTAHRSLAVDRKKIPYGLPIWLDAADPDGEARLQRLMVAQDTGGAITGAVRGDFFWGAGEEAAHKAGLMKSKGFAWVLLPKTEETAEERSVETDDSSTGNFSWQWLKSKIHFDTDK
jgi:membrane-bound lytic murein transglycosylase A